MDAAKSYAQQAWSRSQAFLGSDGLIPQLVLTVVIVLVIHFLIVAVEAIVDGIRKYNQLSATLLPYTYINDSESGSLAVQQKVSGSEFPFMYPSENEVNGVEFSYSYHLYINPSNYSEALRSGTSTFKFKNIFYKGAEHGPWPVMGPGVFLSGYDNTIRIYMNAIDDIKNNYVEIPNIPVGKWFHMVITQKGQDMDVYINGNIAVRKHFNTVPRINFGNLYVFSRNGVSPQGEPDNEGNYPVTGKFQVEGAMNGMISKVKYYAYALSFSQIESLYTEGASKKIITSGQDQKPPYFHDSWWVTRYNPASMYYGV